MKPATEIETTGRAMYQLLARIKRAAKHRKLTSDFEDAMEGHLEAIRKEISTEGCRTSGAESELATALARVVIERQEIQDRLIVIDSAYAAAQSALDIKTQASMVAGEELLKLQDQVRELKQVVAEQKVVIVSQREAYGELYLKSRGASK